MTEADPSPAIQAAHAAMAVREPLARRATAHFEVEGRGVLLLDLDQLLEAAGTGADPDPGYVPASHVPRGDDYRGILHAYDPARELLLLVRLPDGDDTLLRLQHKASPPAP